MLGERAGHITAARRALGRPAVGAISASCFRSGRREFALVILAVAVVGSGLKRGGNALRHQQPLVGGLLPSETISLPQVRVARAGLSADSLREGRAALSRNALLLAPGPKGGGRRLRAPGRRLGLTWNARAREPRVFLHSRITRCRPADGCAFSVACTLGRRGARSGEKRDRVVAFAAGHPRSVASHKPINSRGGAPWPRTIIPPPSWRIGAVPPGRGREARSPVMSPIRGRPAR